MECPVCYTKFDDEELKPCIGTCGHSVCDSCRKRLNDFRCPTCNKIQAFKLRIINYQLIEVLENEEEENAEKKSGDLTCAECNKDADNLGFCIDCGIESQYLIKVGDDLRWNLDVDVNHARLMSVCGNCAFVGIHKGHKVNSIEYLKENMHETQMKQFKTDYQKYSNEIGAVLENLNAMFARNRTTLDEELNREDVNEADYSTYYKKIRDCINELAQLKGLVSGELREDLIMEDETLLVADLAEDGLFLVTTHVENNEREKLTVGKFSHSNGHWQRVDDLELKKDGFATVSVDNKVYIIGGVCRESGDLLKKVEVYDCLTKERRNLADLQYARSNLSATYHNGKIIAACGANGEAKKIVEIYDIQTNEWRILGNLQEQRFSCYLVSNDDDLYVVGGDQAASIEIFNKTSNTFQVISYLPNQATIYDSCAFNGRIFIACGKPDDVEHSYAIKSFDVRTKQWKDEPSLNRECFDCSMRIIYGMIYVLNGFSDHIPSGLKTIDRLNLDRTVWETVYEDFF